MGLRSHPLNTAQSQVPGQRNAYWDTPCNQYSLTFPALLSKFSFSFLKARGNHLRTQCKLQRKTTKVCHACVMFQLSSHRPGFGWPCFGNNIYAWFCNIHDNPKIGMLFLFRLQRLFFLRAVFNAQVTCPLKTNVSGFQHTRIHEEPCKSVFDRSELKDGEEIGNIAKHNNYKSFSSDTHQSKTSEKERNRNPET